MSYTRPSHLHTSHLNLTIYRLGNSDLRAIDHLNAMLLTSGRVRIGIHVGLVRRSLMFS